MVICCVLDFVDHYRFVKVVFTHFYLSLIHLFNTPLTHTTSDSTHTDSQAVNTETSQSPHLKKKINKVTQKFVVCFTMHQTFIFDIIFNSLFYSSPDLSTFKRIESSQDEEPFFSIWWTTSLDFFLTIII